MVKWALWPVSSVHSRPQQADRLLAGLLISIGLTALLGAEVGIRGLVGVLRGLLAVRLIVNTGKELGHQWGHFSA